VRLQHLAKTPLQTVCSALERYQSFVLDAGEGFGLLDLGLNAFAHSHQHTRYNEYCQALYTGTPWHPARFFAHRIN